MDYFDSIDSLKIYTPIYQPIPLFLSQDDLNACGIYPRNEQEDE